MYFLIFLEWYIHFIVRCFVFVLILHLSILGQFNCIVIWF